MHTCRNSSCMGICTGFCRILATHHNLDFQIWKLFQPALVSVINFHIWKYCASVHSRVLILCCMLLSAKSWWIARRSTTGSGTPSMRGRGHLFTLGPVLLVLTTRIIYHRNREAIHSHNHSVSRTVATNNPEGSPTMLTLRKKVTSWL